MKLRTHLHSFFEIHSDDITVQRRGRILQILLLIVYLPIAVAFLIRTMLNFDADRFFPLPYLNFVIAFTLFTILFFVGIRQIRKGSLEMATHGLFFVVNYIATVSLFRASPQQFPIVYFAFLPIIGSVLVSRLKLSFIYAFYALFVLPFFVMFFGDLFFAIIYEVFGLVLTISVWVLAAEWERINQRSVHLSEELQELNLSLQGKVAAQTTDLRRRVTQLQNVTMVGRISTASLELERMMADTLNFIQMQFDYYHASIFLLDENKEYAVVAESTGAVGSKMKENQHKLAIGSDSIVGWATANQKARIALDVGDDPVHFNNPLLPETRSEMALPLISQGELLGVLDVQSVARNAFGEQDVAILQVMADQLAGNIQNARLYSQSQKRANLLAQMPAISNTLIQQPTPTDVLSSLNIKLVDLLDCNSVGAWLWDAEIEKLRLISSYIDGEQYDGEITLDRGQGLPGRLFTENKTIVIDNYQEWEQRSNSARPGFSFESALAVPLATHHETIGLVSLTRNQPSRPFTSEEVQFVEALSVQVSTILENQSLLAETQTRLSETEALYTLSTLIGSNTDLNDIYEQTARVFIRLLSLSRIAVSAWDKSADAITSLGTYVYNKDKKLVERVEATMPIIPLANLPGVAQALHTGEARVIHAFKAGSHPAEQETLQRYGQKTSIQLPIKYGDETFGVIAMFRDQSQADFTTQELRLAAASAGQIAVAINNAISVSQTEESLLKQSALRGQLLTAADVSKAVTTILERDKLLETTVSLIRERFDLYYVGLFLVEKNNVVLRAGTGEAGRIQMEQNHQLPIGQGSMIGQAVASSVAVVEPDVTQAPNWKPNRALPETRSEIALPLKVRGRVIGALTAQSIELDGFPADDVTILQSMSDQLAVAIDNATLFADLQRNLRQQTGLYQAGQQLAKVSDVDSVFNTLIAFVASTNLVDVSHMLSFDAVSASGLKMTHLWHYRFGFMGDDNPTEAVRFSFGSIVPSNQVEVIADARTEMRLTALDREIFEQFRVRSSVLIPILVDGEWQASLALTRNTPDPISEEAYQPFLTLCEQAGVVMANRRLLTETEGLYGLSRRLSEAVSQDSVMEIVVNEVGKQAQVSQCRFIQYKDGMGFLEAAFKPSPLERKGVVSYDAVYERLLFDRELIVLREDETEDLGLVEAHVCQFGSRMSLLVPAFSQNKLIGYLALDSNQLIKPFEEHTKQFAKAAVEQLAVTFENLQLFDDTRRRAQELVILNQVGTKISSALEIGELISVVEEQISRLLVNDGITFAFFDQVTGHFDIQLEKTSGFNEEPQIRSLAPEDLLVQFMKKGTALVLKPHDPLILAEQSVRPSLKAMQSFLWSPLSQEDRPIGLLAVQALAADQYNENDLQLLRSIATQTSLSLSNAHLFAEIQSANEQLRQMDRLKTQFLANMSHELRTPLNSIIGFSRLILKGIDGPITTEQEEDLGSIYSSGKHLLRLINDILDMSKLEAGKMALVFEKVDLNHVAKTSLNTIEPLLIGKPVYLAIDISPNLPVIEADSSRVRQILLNLLSNAVKFTQEGTITLKMSADSEFVHISVHDTGRGIAEKDFETLFKAFEQIDASPTREVGGTGLGLPITRSLVVMHGGNIWVESEVGQGSVFFVTLPIVQSIAVNERLYLEL